MEHLQLVGFDLFAPCESQLAKTTSYQVTSTTETGTRTGIDGPNQSDLS